MAMKSERDDYYGKIEQGGKDVIQKLKDSFNQAGQGYKLTPASFLM